MTEDKAKATDMPGTGQKVLGHKVGAKVADLLSEIEKEPVPDRLMTLALELQKALHDKLK
ncbi:hypothetical protein ACFSE1_15005 [Rhizobium helianthi]|uniref:Anti-sigma factor NepR domain-containing protein n=1 Tax=Rhizobium helianthi TaxID=1132695 RepID=A0ABW4M5Q6_9HYPH